MMYFRGNTYEGKAAKWPLRIAGGLAAVVTVAGCASGGEHGEGSARPGTGAELAGSGESASGTGARYVPIARIEGHGDPRTGALWSRAVAVAARAQPSEDVTATPQALTAAVPGYCEVVVTSDAIPNSNPAGTFEYYTMDFDGSATPDPTDDSSFDPTECFGHLQSEQQSGAMGSQHMALFGGVGVGCALQHVGNFTSNTYQHVYLDIDVFNGDVALQGPYGVPFTTGTASTPAGRNAPQGNDGLWDYGSMAPNTWKDMWIYFKNGAPTDFSFGGFLIGEVMEDCGAGSGNGIDEDCDGVVDNGCGAVDYGGPCFFDEDCVGGTCEGEVITSGIGAGGDTLDADVPGICTLCGPSCDDGNPCTTDSCDPASGCSHVPAAAGTECRAANGACDVAELCDGVATTCPPDAYATASTVCRPPGSACDQTETCDGISTACPPDLASGCTALTIADLTGMDAAGMPAFDAPGLRCKSLTVCGVSSPCFYFGEDVLGHLQSTEAFYDGIAIAPEAVKLQLTNGAASQCGDPPITLGAADTLGLTHDGQVSTVHMPAFSGTEFTLYVGSDGWTFYDPALTQVAGRP